jgi:hypothetical protein
VTACGGTTDDGSSKTDPQSTTGGSSNDQAQHAELAYRFVAWALRTAPHLQSVIKRTFAEELTTSRLEGADIEPNDLPAWAAAGRLTGAELRQVETQAKREVIGVAARALVGGAPSGQTAGRTGSAATCSARPSPTGGTASGVSARHLDQLRS